MVVKAEKKQNKGNNFNPQFARFTVFGTRILTNMSNYTLCEAGCYLPPPGQGCTITPNPAGT